MEQPMSTSYLYHTHGIKGFHHKKTEYSNGEVVFHIQQNPEKLCCVECGSQDITPVRIKKDRDILTLPAGKKNRSSALPAIG